MGFNIKCGQYDVLQSGVILIEKGQPVEFTLDNLLIILEFPEDRWNRRSRWVPEVQDERTLKIKWFNILSVTTSALPFVPIPVGTFMRGR